MTDFHADDGTRLHYEDEGPRDGLPLLCLAGLTRNGQDFQHLLPHLDSVRVIRPDYRGRGRSDWPGPESYIVPREAADQLQLLDHLGIERAAILGTSRGGLVAMMMGAMAKARLRGVAFNDIGPVVERAGLEVIRGYVGLPPADRTVEEAALTRARLWAGFQNVPHDRWVAEVRAQYVEDGETLALRYDPRLREPVLAMMEGEMADLWPLFDALDGLPLAVIRAEASNILSRETVEEMARRRPDLIRTEVPGRGHVPFLDEPEALDVIRRWLAAMG